MDKKQNLKMDLQKKSATTNAPGPAPYNNKRLDSLEAWLKLALTIFIVVVLGMLAVNQSLKFFYNAEFLKTPCVLCADLNPDIKSCIRDLNTRPSYPDGLGGWSNPFAENKFNETIEIEK